ncbi:hypothetical protein R6Q57_014132 [Mikania cordata]
MAEKWLRTHVLSQYPSRNFTTIIVSNTLFCDEDQEHISRLVLLAMQNVHHSLVRWGLEKKIRVSVFLTPKCLHESHHLKPVFELLEEINSTYSLKTHDFSVGILSSYLKSMSDLGFFRSKTMNVVTSVSKQTSRKLSVTVRPPEFHYSVPSDASLPPLIGVTPPPELQFPTMGPVNSAQPPYGHNLPPCNPYPNPHHGGAMAAPPAVQPERVWCVAKPSVPSEKLQEAMDYACGEGGADCSAISPTGSCYFPDSIVAHASYAFNSYWQQNKNNGGSCGFGGTAMLITSDPSFLECHFTFT